MTLEKTLEEFDKEFPCIQSNCDHNGAIAVRVSDDEWEPEQCQYCFEERLPYKNFIITSHIAHYKAEIARLEGEKKKTTGIMEMDLLPKLGQGYRKAIDDQISHYQDLIKEAEGLIK